MPHGPLGRKPGFDQLAHFAHVGATLKLWFEQPHHFAHILDRCGTAIRNGLFDDVVDFSVG